MSKYRVDQYRELQDAVERMQQAWQDEPATARPPGSRDVVERTGGRGTQDPLPYRQTLGKALDRNLEMGGMQPHLAKHLARSADGKNKVVPPLVKSEPRADEWLFPPTDAAQQRAKARSKRRIERWRKRRGGDEADPAEREAIFEEGVDYIEETALPAFEDPTTSGAVAAARTREPLALEEEDTTVEPEATVTGFAYVAGESAYDAWLRKHSEGAEIVSGEGSSYVDRDVTKTHHKRHGPAR